MDHHSDKKTFITACAGCAVQAVFAIVFAVLGAWSGIRGLKVTALYTLFGILPWILAVLHIRQYVLAAEEQYTAGADERESTLFDTEQSVLLSAERKLRQMETYFFPAAACIMGIAMCIYGISAFRSAYLFIDTLQVAKINAVSVILPVCAFCAFVAGKFSAGMAQSNRIAAFLKAGSGVLLSVALLALLFSIALVMYRFEYKWMYTILQYAVPAVLVIVGVDYCLRVVLDLYRPRVAGGYEKPAYQSFLLSLFSEPGGILKAVAHALDYQFGFKISDTWLYKFLEKIIAPLALFQFFVLYLASAVVIIEPHQCGIVERFGKPCRERGVLNAGIHFIAPWPIETVRVLPSKRIQSVKLNPSDTDRTRILWAEDHHHDGHQEHLLIVPAFEPVDSVLRSAQYTSGGVPVNLAVLSADVQYTIADPYNYAYSYDNVSKLIEQISWRAVTRIAATTDLFDFLGRQRLSIGEQLKKEIQKEADIRGAGVLVHFVGLYENHPPHQVSEAFQSVVGSIEEKQAAVLRAETFAGTLLPAAQARATELTAQAQSYAGQRTAISQAESDRFKTQNEVYQLAPVTYRWRTYLETVSDSLSGVRKIIMSRSLRGDEIDVIDLTEKTGVDLFDVDVTREKEK
ncbi:protease modulator HflK [bacterium]|nr:protease modulator HflK [bacterium]